MTRTIRVDADVQTALKQRRLPGETNSDEAILRSIERHELEAKLAAGGLTSWQMGRLADLRGMGA